MISFENYSINIYGDYIINDISFEISTNGIYVLCGESGSGKSTILNAIAGTDYFKDAEFDGTKSNSFKNTEMHYVTVDDNVNTYLNVNAFMHLYSKNQNEIDQILSELSILELKNQKCSLLSRGESERVAIAAALIDNKEVILIDEPTANIDVELSKQVFDVILKYSKEKIVIIATHDYKMIEDKADGLIYLEEGRIVKNTITNKDDSRIEKTKKKKYVPVKSYFKFSLSSVLSAKIGFVINTIVLSVTFLSLFILFYMTGLDYNGSYSKYIRNSINDALRTNDYLHVVKNEEGKRDLGYIELLEEENASKDDILLSRRYLFDYYERLPAQVIFLSNCENDEVNKMYEKFNNNEGYYPVYFSNNFKNKFEDYYHRELKKGFILSHNGTKFIVDGFYDGGQFDAIMPDEVMDIKDYKWLNCEESIIASFNDTKVEFYNRVLKVPSDSGISLSGNEIAISRLLFTDNEFDYSKMVGKTISIENNPYFFKDFDNKTFVIKEIVENTRIEYCGLFFSDEYYDKIVEIANKNDYDFNYYFYYSKDLIKSRMNDFTAGKLRALDINKSLYTSFEEYHLQAKTIKNLSILVSSVFVIISLFSDIIYLHNVNKKSYKNYSLFILTGKARSHINSVYVVMTSMILFIPLILSIIIGPFVVPSITKSIITNFDPGISSISTLSKSFVPYWSKLIGLLISFVIGFIVVLFPTILMLRRKKAVKELDYE